MFILGPTRWAERNCNSIEDSFLLFFRSPLMDKLCKWTNKEGNLVYGNAWKKLEVSELKKYLGVLILMGVCKSKNENISQMYNKIHGRPLFGKIMSRDRFKEITRVMRFDDAEARRKHRSPDKLEPIRDLFDTWNTYLRDAYVPGWSVTVDEQLVTFRGRCPFRQYIPSKPGKYGIKFWVCCDALTSYVWKMEIYKGKETGEERERNQGERVVKTLVKEIENSGRNITCDNFFTSLSLSRQLLMKNLTLVGTIRKNKGELPNEFIATKGRATESTMFGFQDDTMIVSYCPKKGRVVTLLSTLHNQKEIDEGEKNKPAVIKTYNETKAGVDKADQMARNYSVKRKTRRWPMAVFSNMVDISALNAFIIYLQLFPNELGTKSSKRRRFLMKLGMELGGVITDETDVEVQAGPSTQMKSQKKKRCFVCPAKKDRKTKTVCEKCLKNICKEHSAVVCCRCK